jgi:hypothetical protein
MPDNFLISLDDADGATRRTLRVAEWIVRIALALLFASIIANRFGLWRSAPRHPTFIWLLPTSAQQAANWIVTCIVVLLILALLTGWQRRWAALLGTLILGLHGIAAFVFIGPLAPLTYVTFGSAAAAFLLFSIQPTNRRNKP